MNIYDLFRPKVKTEFQDISFFANDTRRSVKTILTVDATLEAEQSTELTPTDHPVEKGKEGFIVDHLNLKPLRLSIRGIIANEPLDVKGALIGSYAGAVGMVTSKYATPFVGQLVQTKLGGELTEAVYGTKSRAKSALETLMALQINKQVFKVITKLRVYNNMILEGLTVPASDGDEIEFSGSMREIRVVETDYVTIQRNVKDVGASAIPSKNEGIKSKKPLTPPQRDKTATKILVDRVKSGLGL